MKKFLYTPKSWPLFFMIPVITLLSVVAFHEGYTHARLDYHSIHLMPDTAVYVFYSFFLAMGAASLFMILLLIEKYFFPTRYIEIHDRQVIIPRMPLRKSVTLPFADITDFLVQEYKGTESLIIITRYQKVTVTSSYFKNKKEYEDAFQEIIKNSAYGKELAKKAGL